MDINVKPIAQPIVTSVPRPAEQVVAAVPTQLPPSQTVSAAGNSSAPRNDTNTRKSEVTVDRAAAAIVYQVVDQTTDQVISQFPEDAVLRRRAYFNALDKANTDRPKSLGDGWIA